MLTLAGCGGMAKVASDTGRKLDKYDCLARELKGEKPCLPQDADSQ
jgi:hypothetical protein